MPLNALQRYYAQRSFNGGMGTLIDFGDGEDEAAKAAAHWIIENSERGRDFALVNSRLYSLEVWLGLA